MKKAASKKRELGLTRLTLTEQTKKVLRVRAAELDVKAQDLAGACVEIQLGSEAVMDSYLADMAHDLYRLRTGKH